MALLAVSVGVVHRKAALKLLAAGSEQACEGLDGRMVDLVAVGGRARGRLGGEAAYALCWMVCLGCVGRLWQR
jgi:hypothetical protein